MTREAQAARAVFMVRPDRFGSNPETLASNRFQRAAAVSNEIRTAAVAECEGLALALVRAGVDVHVFAGRAQALGAESAGAPARTAADAPEPVGAGASVSPDEVFPNNWVSTHGDGALVLYPLMAPSRRLERRADIVAALEARFHVTRRVDLTAHERRGAFLEGTGSLVLDRPGRVAYACRSPRTAPAVLEIFAAELGYDPYAFEAFDPQGRPIYHTNVLMALGTHFAVLCTAAVPDADARRGLQASLEAGGRELIAIDFAQLAAFAGNVLELAGSRGPIAALSTRALASLRPFQRRRLERHAELVAADVGTIETYGGGGVRCMLAEIHLPAGPHDS